MSIAANQFTMFNYCRLDTEFSEWEKAVKARDKIAVVEAQEELDEIVTSFHNFAHVSHLLADFRRASI